MELKKFLGATLPMTHKYFSMHGGYTLALDQDLLALNAHLATCNRDELLCAVRVGLQQDAQVICAFLSYLHDRRSV